jgi:hypothetical protein
MAFFPRPAAPRVLIADIRAFARERSRVQWVGLAVAIGMPILIIAGFAHDAVPERDPQLIMVKSWPANRTDAQIMAEQKTDEALMKAAKAEKQRQFRKLGNQLGIE